MNRGLKKFLYGIFYLACFAGIVFLFVRPVVRVAPTCFDSVKNQGETGVDCGGPCVACAEKNLLPLQAFQPYRLLALSTGKTALIFGVANPNSTYHAVHFTYHIDVLDRSGTKIEQLDNTDSLYADERKYILEPRLDAQFKNIGSVEVTLTNPEWRSVESRAAPSFSLSGIMTETVPNSIRVSGTVTNTSGITARDVTLIAVAYTKDRTRIFASQNILSSLAGFQNASFTVPFPADPVFQNVDASRTEVFISGK